MPAIKRNISRISHSYVAGDDNSPHSNQSASSATLLVQPKHARIPHIPADSELSFSVFMLFFSFSCMSLQYIHLYKTTWWLPNSHHQYAINFRLIDYKLVGYLVSMLCLPLLLTLFRQLRNIPNRCCFTACLALLCALCITYALVFYGHVPGTLLSRNWLSGGGGSTPQHQKSSATASGAISSSESAANGQGSFSPRHSCSRDPEKIRDETEALKSDFNGRLKIILFSTLFSSFHSAFVPLLFVQNTIYLEPWFCGVHVAVTVASAFLFYTQHHLPPHRIDTLHRCALHLGCWVRVEGRGSAQVPYIPWSELQVWQQGALVKHVKGLFKAEGITNSAEPGNSMHSRFHSLFYSPMRLADGLQCAIALLLVLQFAVLLQCHEWYKVLSSAIMMLFNLVSLYKLTRNRLVFKRCYADLEDEIHGD
uniref:Transmembrane protein 39A n=1 Tax=Macrostomum lignano TaxID=282301 RepID=A0A1I8GGU1_9PLAT